MDSSKIEPGHPIIYTPVTRPKYWKIDVKNILVNSKLVTKFNRGGNDNKKSNIVGIMDTSTTLMIVPRKLTRMIHRRIPGAKELRPSWAVPCDLVTQSEEGSKVELEIEGKRFGISFEDLVRKETEEDGMCFSDIQPSSASFMIIGDVFIKNNYVAFDQEHKRIGVAPLRPDKLLKIMNRHMRVRPRVRKVGKDEESQDDR